MQPRYEVSLVDVRVRVGFLYNPGASVTFAPDREGQLRDLSTERPSSDSADIRPHEVAAAKSVAHEFLRGQTFSAKFPPQGDRAELAMLESQHPGGVRLVLATRNRAVLFIRGRHREFIENEGQLLLVAATERLPDKLYRLAFLRAQEAINAVRKGHAEAREERIAAKSKTVIQLRLPV